MDKVKVSARARHQRQRETEGGEQQTETENRRRSFPKEEFSKEQELEQELEQEHRDGKETQPESGFLSFCWQVFKYFCGGKIGGKGEKSNGQSRNMSHTTAVGGNKTNKSQRPAINDVSAGKLVKTGTQIRLL